MARIIKISAMLLLSALVVSGSAQEKEKKLPKLEYKGIYTAWAQSQHAFKFDKDHYRDQYVVQMLRFRLQFNASKHVRAITRFDIAQGWWGVDNALRSVQRTGTGGASALFDFKDTNFLVHVDQAYMEFDFLNYFTGRIGRMWYGLGNKIMVDNNYDGVQIDLHEKIGKRLTLSYAKVSEGADNLSDLEPEGTTVITDPRDADLFSLDLFNATGNLAYNIYGMYYNDASTKDMTAYVPDVLQFFKTRFSPQITQLITLGVAGNYKTNRWTVQGELDFLTGKDDINNTILNEDSVSVALHGAKQMWDINNGDLQGYNIFLKSTYAVSTGVKLGGIFGMGSGDSDPTSGNGNVNKLRTSGFFYITEVWEDSIMPDEEGITPQGLGAPNVRGYRELENTIALQGNILLHPNKVWDLFASYTYLRANQPIYAWSPIKFNDIDGNEITDAKIDLNTSSK
ncbi:MAG: hypothetical protein ACE5GL_04440, partial [Calditrichia bacterium]